MTQTARNLLYIIAPLLVSACLSVRNIPIETLQPANLTFEEPRNIIAIIAPQTLFADAVRNNAAATNIFTDSLNYNILYSLQRIWEEAPGYEDAQFFVKITSSDSISEEYSNYDQTVHLERLEINNTYYGQQYGFFDWEAYIYVYYTARWLIYNKSGALTDEYTDRDLIIWSSGLYSTRSDAVENLPEISDVWWDLGIAIAQSYSTHVVPQWQTGVRYIYMVNKFPELSQMAYRAMQNDRYVHAFDIWENMLLSCRKRGQKNIKSQITYNMAISNEFQNQLEQAVYWTQRSLNLKYNYRTINYLNLLQERKQHQIILDLQTLSNN